MHISWIRANRASIRHFVSTAEVVIRKISLNKWRTILTERTGRCIRAIGSVPIAIQLLPNYRSNQTKAGSAHSSVAIATSNSANHAAVHKTRKESVLCIKEIGVAQIAKLQSPNCLSSRTKAA